MDKDKNKEKNPIRTKEMLQEECNFLRAPSGTSPEDRMLQLNTSALCLSGGGIRSATFCLGAIQALAKAGKLDKFTYLSTVSGGGYIGSWLSRWVQQAGGIDKVQQKLAQNDTTSREPLQVTKLRAYSNYLSPVQGLSGDLFSLISIVLRNLLLNWLVLLPLIGACVLLPYVYIGLLIIYPASNAIQVALSILAATLLVSSTSYMFMDISPRKEDGEKKQQLTKDQFGLGFLIPIALASLILSFLPPWIGINWFTNDWLLKAFLCAGATILLLGRTIANIRQCDSKETSGPHGFLGAGFFGIIGGLWIYQAFQWLHSFDKLLYDMRPLDIGTLSYTDVLPYTDKLPYATVAFPILMASIWLASSLHVALTRKWSSESKREWWAKSGGWLIKVSLIWITCFTLAIMAPQWILSLEHVQKLINESWGFSSGTVGGGFLGLLIGLAGYLTKNGPVVTGKARKLSNLTGIRLLELAALAFIALLFIGISFWWSWWLDGNLPLFKMEAGRWPAMVMHAAAMPSTRIAMVSLLVIAFASSQFVGINTFSLHHMYGNRLARTYLGAARASEKRNPHWFTGFDDADNVKMAELKQHTSPLHVLNLTLNIVSPSREHLKRQQRKAASFTVTPLHSGSSEIFDDRGGAYQPSEQYAGGMSLARSMAISGAAASPNMGYHPSPAVTFVMTLFNVRLGWWLPNPGNLGKTHWKLNEPGWRSLKIHLSEALGIRKSNTPFVYLSDGGHFENLGLYEMVRRRCRNILLLDASADPEYGYQDLQDAIRKIRIDFGISIDFSADSFDYPRRWTTGTINYHETDKNGDPYRGSLCYIKPMLFGDEPLDVKRYSKISQKRDGKSVFPHQSTSDQFFDEEQFESYRMLGYHMISQVFPHDSGSTDNWPAASAPTNTSKQDDKSSMKNSQKEESHPSSDRSSNIQNLTKNATLASALAAGGILGVSGTVALKNTSIEIKPGSEISISKESLENLKKSISNQPENTQYPDAPGFLKSLENNIEGIKIQLESVSNSQRLIAEALGKIPKNAPPDIQGKIKSLQTGINSIFIKIGDHQTNQTKNQQIDDLWGELQKMDKELRTLKSLINDTHPRRNVRGIEGVKP